MAKSQLFKPPVLDFIINHGGVFPVRRGQRDQEAFITAHTIFDRGGMVLMYAEGGRSRNKELGQPKPGLGRLALEAGVPVVPVAIHGSEHVREAKRLRLPKVTVQYGEPLHFGQVDHPDEASSRRRSPTRYSSACATCTGRLRSRVGAACSSACVRSAARALRPRAEQRSQQVDDLRRLGFHAPMGDADHPVAGEPAGWRRGRGHPRTPRACRGMHGRQARRPGAGPSQATSTS